MGDKMKKACLFVLLTISFFLFGCNPVSGNPDTSSGNPDTNSKPDSNSKSDDYNLILDDLSPWNDKGEGTYNKQTHQITITVQYSAVQIWFNEGFDASDYKYAKVSYEKASQDFGLVIADTSEPAGEINTMCSAHVTDTYLPLEGINKKSIRKILIVKRGDAEDLSLTVKGICFTNALPENVPVIDKGNQKSFNSTISAIDLVKNMQAGWNLGNTLDSYADYTENHSIASETCWGELYTTKEIIDIGKNNGFKTIRISCTWFNHIIDDDYTIDGNWMRRVKTIVDWAIEDGYYVILDDHHSVREGMSKPIKYGEGYIVRNTQADITESEAFLKAIWTQIATAFNNSYNEHLIFETMNEPRNPDDSHKHTWQCGLKLDWVDNSQCEECLADYRILNEYNQICLNAIRATGGNNANRFIMIPSVCTGLETPMHELFELPEDSAEDKLILTVHDYRMGVNLDLLKSEFTDEMKSEIDKSYEDLNEKFISKGIPVVVGETGALRKIDIKEKVKWMDYFGSVAKNYGISIVYWECGGTKDDDFSIIDRKNLCIRPEQKAFAEALTKAFE